MTRNIVVSIFVVLLILAGVYYYQHNTAEKAMDSGDTLSPDKSVSTSLAPAPDPTPAPSPAPVAKRTSMPGSSTVSAASIQSADTNTGAPPASDSIDRNPPNGMVFAGTGHMQVYRQGNITWRINTDNGDACVLFATDREWRKPRVYQRGCANS